MSQKEKISLNMSPVNYDQINTLLTEAEEIKTKAVFKHYNSVDEVATNIGQVKKLEKQVLQEKNDLKKKKKRWLKFWIIGIILAIILAMLISAYFDQKKAIINESEEMQKAVSHAEQVNNLVSDLDFNEVKADIKQSLSVEPDKIDEAAEAAFDDSEEAFLKQIQQKEEIKKVFPQDIISVYFDANVINFNYDSQGNYYKIRMAFLPKDFNVITNFYQDALNMKAESFKSDKIETETFKGMKDDWYFTVNLEIKPSVKNGLLEITLSKKS